jgi:predicted small metal-binding protein
MPSDTNCIARIDLGGGKTPVNSDLAAVIPIRTTNRKPYKKTPIQEAHLDSVKSSVRSFEELGLSCTWHTDGKEIQALAEVGSTNEEIMLGNQELHGFFFSHLTWTRE